MDGLRDWIDEEEMQGLGRSTELAEAEQVKGWSMEDEDAAYEWEWKVPDLRKGGKWHKA
jgi:hypothetical protein